MDKNSNWIQTASNAYSSAAETVPPVVKIIMLYDGILARLHDAKAAIGDGKIEQRSQAIDKASSILSGLHACLDHDNGGSIAQLLDQLYSYGHRRLQEVNVRNDPAVCDELTTMFTELRTSWASIAEGDSQTLTSAPATVGNSRTLHLSF